MELGETLRFGGRGVPWALPRPTSPCGVRDPRAGGVRILSRQLAAAGLAWGPGLAPAVPWGWRGPAGVPWLRQSRGADGPLGLYGGREEGHRGPPGGSACSDFVLS